QLTCIRSCGRPNPSARFHQVHQTTSLRKSDAQLSLQHRSRTKLRGNYQVNCLEQVIHILADVVIDFLLGCRCLLLSHTLGVVRLCLRPRGFDNGMDFLIGDECTLDTHGTSALRDEQGIAHTYKLFRTALVQDNSRVSQRRGSKSQTRRHVRLDQTSNNVDGGSLGCQYQVNTCGTSLLGNTHDGIFNFLRRSHHQVRQLINDTDNEWVWPHLAL